MDNIYQFDTKDLNHESFSYHRLKRSVGGWTYPVFSVVREAVEDYGYLDNEVL